ncbi:MAG: phenylacetate-CoA oxygenase/reductase subunit PaaK [Rubrivivax sp.]|jgi:ring-1,2-phenylacetyl-CoA epoxidase subunit PaaE|nr:phenylacetate-CoA oxygenase/reductase subunit PaaK [Betaproteobacteria bacterium]MBP6318857.1 phenylacetate-CoA oxygenase/reductase subunit PaaK [Rubrivivax sp.]MBK7459064.1 phenylacetate-CoA oxygenase/reductase subunit PaaK [Betaproteobacteria bacterium]MBK7514539.1 phenylacetate-CoA oxygenase/reductase subunit PaaK [Betaproteobacteria bacterium]MBK8104970.1 phenylacetate-CoA oxygenase/reductase subunit PaaK [Betaproteobacteria bacterium]
MSGLHFHPLRVAAVRPDGDDARVVTFDVPADQAASFRFEPGQYLTLRAIVGGAELRRSYSICAAPGEALRVGVRQVPGGAFSSWLQQTLRPGDLLDVMEPQGRFGAALARRPRHVLAVAGGSGITPILSILKSLLAGDPKAQATLLYGNRSAASTMFKEELEDLKNRHLTRLSLHPVFSREVVDSPLNAGRLDAAKVASFLRLAGPVDEAFVCGPHAMNDEVEAALLAAGVPPERLHVERFGIPPTAADATLHAPKEGDATTARISIVRDGLTREVAFQPSDESILAAAARAGLDVPYSCRSGVCATCRAKLLEGRVRMDRNFALEQADLDAGFVLTCQAHPLTDRVVVSFDER